jgi:hypothetical protein
LRFGHRVAGENPAFEERLEVALLVVLGAVVRQDFSIAGIGRLAAEYERRQAGPTQDLVQQRELDLTVSLPA